MLSFLVQVSYPYVFVPPARYDSIQGLRAKGKWTLTCAKDRVNNFTKQFNKIRSMAHVSKGTFHDIRKTAITNWFRQGLSEYDVMTLAGQLLWCATAGKEGTKPDLQSRLYTDYGAVMWYDSGGPREAFQTLRRTELAG